MRKSPYVLFNRPSYDADETEPLEKYSLRGEDDSQPRSTGRAPSPSVRPASGGDRPSVRDECVRGSLVDRLPLRHPATDQVAEAKVVAGSLLLQVVMMSVRLCHFTHAFSQVFLLDVVGREDKCSSVRCCRFL